MRGDTGRPSANCGNAEHEGLIEHTIRFWQERTGREVTAEDAREMIVNIRGFFGVLAEWAERADEEERNTRRIP